MERFFVCLNNNGLVSHELPNVTSAAEAAKVIKAAIKDRSAQDWADTGTDLEEACGIVPDFNEADYKGTLQKCISAGAECEGEVIDGYLIYSVNA